jgi:HEAT repeat protein
MTYLERDPAEWVADLASPDPLLRRLAAHALAEADPPAAAAVPALRDAIADDEPFVRVWFAAALARLAPEDPAALPVLTAALNETQSFVRSLAAWHLGRLGSGHPGIDAAVAPLDAATRDGDLNVRAEAALALRRCTTKQRLRSAPD